MNAPGAIVQGYSTCLAVDFSPGLAIIHCLIMLKFENLHRLVISCTVSIAKECKFANHNRLQVQGWRWSPGLALGSIWCNSSSACALSLSPSLTRLGSCWRASENLKRQRAYSAFIMLFRRSVHILASERCLLLAVKKLSKLSNEDILTSQPQ